MKFACAQSTLLKALNIVSKAVTSRTTIPILKGILIRVTEEGSVIMSASDLDISIEDRFETVEYEPGEVVVQAKLFGDIVRKLPSDIIYMEENDVNFNIKCSSSEFNIVGSSADEFPSMNIDDYDEKLTFDRDILKDMIRKTVFAASADESRGVITGVLFELKNGNFNMVALDGFRMAVARESIQSDYDQNIILPARTLMEVAKIISESGLEKTTVEVLLSDKRAVFIMGDIKVAVRLLSGDYIDYENILPKDSQIRVTLNRSDLIDAVERASLLSRAGKNNLIRVNIGENILEITSESEEGKGREEVMISREGKDLSIGFNSKFFEDPLKYIEDESVTLLFNTPISPCIIKPVEGNSFEYLVLPVRLLGN